MPSAHFFVLEQKGNEGTAYWLAGWQENEKGPKIGRGGGF